MQQDENPMRSISPVYKRPKHDESTRMCVANPPLLEDALSPKVQKELSIRRRSYMAMTKNQLQKECRKQKVTRSSLPSSPNKKDLVDLLLLKEFASQKKENANDKTRRGAEGKMVMYRNTKGDQHGNRMYILIAITSIITTLCPLKDNEDGRENTIRKFEKIQIFQAQRVPRERVTVIVVLQRQTNLNSVR